MGTAAVKDSTASRTDSTIGRLLQVGDFGLGAGPLVADNPNSLSIGNDCDLFAKAGFFEGVGAGTNFRIPTAPILVLPRRGGGDGTGQVSQLQMSASVMSFRYREANIWSVWRDVYHTGNTTRGSDGTLKAASPVVKLFHDGKSETNDESDGCLVTRMGVGQYLIKNCIGLNSDAAWGGINGGFDIPKDRNGQELIWLDYDVNADGSILVKTYHRTYPNSPSFARNEITDLADGEPVDIPADQFVSIRVEMPVDSIWNQKMAAIQAEPELPLAEIPEE